MEILSGPAYSQNSQHQSNVYFQECHECHSVYLYREDEIQHDFREGDSWTQCPSCRHLNDHNGLNGWNDLNDNQKEAVKNRQPIPNDY